MILCCHLFFNDVPCGFVLMLHCHVLSFVAMWRSWRPSCTHLISLAMSSSLSLLLLRTNHRQRMRRKMKPNTEPNVAPTIIPAFVANSRNHGTHNCYISTSHITQFSVEICSIFEIHIINICIVVYIILIHIHVNHVNYNMVYR